MVQRWGKFSGMLELAPKRGHSRGQLTHQPVRRDREDFIALAAQEFSLTNVPHLTPKDAAAVANALLQRISLRMSHGLAQIWLTSSLANQTVMLGWRGGNHHR